MSIAMRSFTATLLLAVVTATTSRADEPLPSWNEGAAKKAIIEFVARVTKEGGTDYVRPAERIAVFDNDGTLWCEQPMYVQLRFALDRVKVLADKHPEWKDKEPFRSALADDLKGLAKSGTKGIAELVMATHAGMTEQEFAAVVREWLPKAKHPRFGRTYAACTYQPMQEVLRFLRANGFKTFIVSGGGVEFMRVFAERVYGVPPEQVIGSTIKSQYEARDGKPALIRLPGLDFIDGGPGKPVAINKFIGRRPIMAFGNSDGDFQMLEWTTSGPGARFGLIVHHTDADREYAYDRESSVGRLDKGLSDASARGWVLADMKRDWKVVFAFEKAKTANGQ